MSRLDDRIRDGLREAGPAAAPDLGALTDEITRRRHRRDTVRRVQAGAVALGVIAVLAISFSLAITRSQQDDVPIGPQPTPTTPPSAGVATITGIPFPVCRPMPIPGDFGEGLDTLWMVTESGPDQDCSAPTGSQYLGIGSPSEVVVLSGPLDDIGQQPAAVLWPFATPDIDGDGIDEIGVGLAGSRNEGYALVALYRVSAGSVEYVSFDCGPTCRPVPWLGVGTFVESLSGAYCGPEGFVRWSASQGRVIGTVWSLEGDRLVRGQDIFDRVDDGTDYPHDGLTDLCGSPSTFPEDFPTYPDQQSGSSSPVPVTEGEDIGIGTNVCDAERLGGLDILQGGAREAAWTGYLAKDDGTCPDRRPDAQIWIVALDAAADGVADTWTTFPPFNCPYVGCRPLAATDLDGDGDGELIVITTGFSVQDQIYFEIEAGDGGASIAPILVAPPGHPAAYIAGSEPLITSSGGDEGHAAWIRCEGYPAAPVLVFTWVNSLVESQPSDWHEVKLQLRVDGMFHVIDHTDLSLPRGEDPGLIRSDAPACGVDFTT